MAASSIPNLLSLGGSRGGRGRARGRHGQAGSRAGEQESHDMDIQGTDTDAAVSRLSAVQMGYLNDPFAEFFVQAGAAAAPPRRLPIINRGTFARTTALDQLVARFLSSSDPSLPRQIVSLGAGTDTRSLRLFAGAGPASAKNLTYHEIDFPEICTRKMRTVQMTPALRDVLRDPTAHDDGSWTAFPAVEGARYRCHGIDLRHLGHVLPRHQAALPLPDLRTDVPTLLVSECCLCYMSVPDATATLEWFAARIAASGENGGLGVVLYEPIRAHDAFGRVMVSNLAARRIQMPTIHAYHEPADQVERLARLGMQGGAACATVDEVWDGWVSAEERERADSLEGLDEVEEWELLAKHYAVVWGWKGTGFGQWEGLGP